METQDSVAEGTDILILLMETNFNFTVMFGVLEADRDSFIYDVYVDRPTIHTNKDCPNQFLSAYSYPTMSKTTLPCPTINSRSRSSR